jgi:hypothetical protein
MYPYFDIEGISAERLLREWKWLVSGEFSLLALNAFGDLFLKDGEGTVHRLDVVAGRIAAITNSEEEFRNAANEPSKQQEWFLVGDAEKAKQKGYSPGKGQCVGGKIPWVFRESAGVVDNLCVIDLYQYVSFMGDVHHQMRGVADGDKVRIKIVP